jgi:TPR repeat protein
MRATGTGAPADLVEACKWLSLAVTRASPDKQQDYRETLADVMALMTPRQVADARKRASDWIAEFNKRVKK